MTPTSREQKSRRWFQYRLRSLFLLTFCIAVVMSVVVAKRERVRCQRAALSVLTKSGGYVLYDYQVDASGRRLAGAVPPGPEWLRDWVGVDMLSDPVVLSCDASVVDAELAHLSALPMLRDVYFSANHREKITDRGLENLRFLPRLRLLWLSGADVGDETMQHIACLTELEILAVCCSPRLTDEGLAVLPRLRRLRQVDLSGTSISSRGVRRIADLKDLMALTLAGTRVTDEGVAMLRNTQSLLYLNLRDTAIGDEAMEHIARMRNLVFLDVARTRISDRGLALLARHPNLEAIDLEGTAITDESARILKLLPQLQGVRVRKTGMTRAGMSAIGSERPVTAPTDSRDWLIVQQAADGTGSANDE